MAQDVLDKIYGCLAGGAIGDALGAPAEGLSHSTIQERYGKIEEFKGFTAEYSDGNPGSISGDSVVRHYLCLAIVDNGGRVLPEELAETWKSHLDRDRVWINEEIVHTKLLLEMNPWRTGRNLLPTTGGMMGIAPVGLINAGNPRQAYQDALNLASMNQDGVHRDAAGPVAAGTARAMEPDATLESVLDVMKEYASDLLTRAIELTFDLALDAVSPDEFIKAYYDEMLDWRWPAMKWDTEQYYEGNLHSSTTMEVLPVVMALMSLCDGEPHTSMVEGVSFGRDCDTIASVIGCITGTLNGASKLDQSQVSRIEEANREFFEDLFGDSQKDFRWMAEQLESVLQGQQDRARQRAQSLSAILDQGDTTG